MKIVFMGTPDFAIPSLKKIMESNHTVISVITAPDKQRGRGKQISPTPIKEFALKNNIPVLTPEKLKDEIFIQQLKDMEPDLFVVVAFRILPKEVYSIPIYGSFNLHGSLLPKYRGAAPIQWAIINGDPESGVTTFFLEDKVDTGNIILQEKVLIDDEDDCGVLHDKLMMLGADVVMRTVDMIDAGNIIFTKQDDSAASPAPKITKEICLIDWSKSAVEIHNLIRGLSPYPAAFFTHNGKNYKVFKTKIIGIEELRMEGLQFVNLNSQLPVKLYQTQKEIYIETINGLLQILELQLEGRKRMTAEEFLRGYSFIK